jgi:hypothetical protein
MKNALAEAFSRQIEETRSLAEWKRWFSILVVVIALLCLVFLVEKKSAESVKGLAEHTLYVVLFALGGYALYSNWRDAQRIELEIQLASRDARHLVECNDIGLFLDQTQPGAGAEASTSYFRNHIESLYKIYAVSSEINQDNLIEILHSRLLAKNKRIELQANVLVTLGLIGTIVGLLMMMSKLAVVINGAAAGTTPGIKELMGAGGPLEGLAVAFVATLIAASFGGVMLRILTGIVEEGTTKYVALISELTEVYVLPMLRSHAAHLERGGEG